MNYSFLRSCTSVAVFVFAFSYGSSRQTVAAPAGQPTPPAGGTTTRQQSAALAQAQGPLLAQAYNVLSIADHDYQGHRVRAMKHIEAAAKKLGVSLQGNGTGHEQQATSDAQLRQAQALLQQVSAALASTKHPAVMKQVTAAINELTVALSIK
jgi:hypothetical protein